MQMPFSQKEKATQQSHQVALTFVSIFYISQYFQLYPILLGGKQRKKH
jgi:hypothetical protein